jgi:hypothetical protein
VKILRCSCLHCVLDVLMLLRFLGEGSKSEGRRRCTGQKQSEPFGWERRWRSSPWWWAPAGDRKNLSPARYRRSSNSSCVPADTPRHRRCRTSCPSTGGERELDFGEIQEVSEPTLTGTPNVVNAPEDLVL